MGTQGVTVGKSILTVHPSPPKAVRDRKVLFQKRRQKRRDLLFCPVEQDLNMSHLTSPFPR